MEICPFPEKPMPLTVIEVPTYPVSGVMVILGATVKLNVALLVPSVMTTGCVPEALCGTEKVVLNDPVASAVAVPTGTASKVMVIDPLEAKLDPVALTVVPTNPFTGLMFALDVTLKTAVAENVPSLTVTWWLPPEVRGTAKLAVKAPVEFV
jgi:hypothetical protein